MEARQSKRTLFAPLHRTACPVLETKGQKYSNLPAYNADLVRVSLNMHVARSGPCAPCLLAIYTCLSGIKHTCHCDLQHCCCNEHCHFALAAQRWCGWDWHPDVWNPVICIVLSIVTAI